MDRLDKLVDAALPHVAFDGWSQETLRLAAQDAGLTPKELKALAPRGPVSLAAAYHRRADRLIAAEGMEGLRYSQKVAELIWRRLQGADKEVVRRSSALFSLPQHSAEGAALIWSSADAIWTCLGDTSEDLNWYSKRTILSGVIGSVVLFWLGDTSEGETDTRAFIDRRINEVMQFEEVKRRLRASSSLRPVTELVDRLAERVRAPDRSKRAGFPGWQEESEE